MSDYLSSVGNFLVIAIILFGILLGIMVIQTPAQIENSNYCLSKGYPEHRSYGYNPFDLEHFCLKKVNGGDEVISVKELKQRG